MKKRILSLLLAACLCLPLFACAGQDTTTNIYFSIHADEVPALGDSVTLPAIDRDIFFPLYPLEKQDVLHAIAYACNVLGYECIRDGKYSENLVSIEGRTNGENSYWVIEGKDESGKAIPLKLDSGLRNVYSISITYINLNK